MLVNSTFHISLKMCMSVDDDNQYSEWGNKWLTKFSPLMTFLCQNGRTSTKYKVNISKNDFNKRVDSIHITINCKWKFKCVTACIYLSSFQICGLLTIAKSQPIKSNIKRGAQVELKLKKCRQMKNDNSKIVMFKNSRTCWNKRSKCKGWYLIFIKAIPSS
jgi:hypothetical protein